VQSLGKRDHITLVTQRVLEAVLAIVNMRRVRERGQQWVTKIGLQLNLISVLLDSINHLILK